DSNPGTSSLPWQTFARIQTGPLYPGTTIYCTGDFGDVNIDSADPCGTSQASITYARWSGHDMPHIGSLTFDTSPVRDVHLVFQEFDFDPGYIASCINPPPAITLTGVNHVTFDSCDIEGAKLAGNPPGDFAPYSIQMVEPGETMTSGVTVGGTYISVINCTFANSAYGIRVSADHWEILGCDFNGAGNEDGILATGNEDLVVAGCHFHGQTYAKSPFSWPGTPYGTWPADYSWGTCTQDNTGASAIFYFMRTMADSSKRLYLLADDDENVPRRSQYYTWRLDSDPTNVYFVPSAEGDCTHTDAMAVQGATDGMLIENNLIECEEYGGQSIKLDPNGIPGNPLNVTIRNNLMVTQLDEPANLFNPGGGDNILVVHNTIDAGPVHPARAIRFYTVAAPVDIVLRNNIFSGAIWDTGYTTPPDSDYNCWMTTPAAGISEGANSIVVTRTQVGFADWENGDYHLTSSSYAIDEGDPNYAPAVSQEHPEGIDYDSNDRDESPDMGAYEYIE
ncbi:MAG TPA: hypothetical protein PLP01_14865, partial [Phycisphaerae bacterium]|nr:hypothetical protein [Phycisphaerae bacterium]